MGKHMHEQQDNKFIPMTSITSRAGEEVSNDVYFYTDQIANVGFIGLPETGEWVLIDAGMPNAAPEILVQAKERFGEDNPPHAIILTHGHFDHVGGLVDLIEKWNVPVYAHELEMPYLTGKKSYPEPDSSVEGGFLAKISPMYPNEPVDLGDAVKPLPADHGVPGLDDWEWIHTPGHSPGHVSFFRKNDRILLSGDAVITVRQDSFTNVFMQTPEVNGPPRYLTTDWMAAWDSVKKLADLNPRVVVPGHGQEMRGKKLTKGLKNLVDNFEELAIPDYGRYVDKRKH